MTKTSETFELEWHGDAVVVKPSADVESMSWELIEHAAELVLKPIDERETPMVIFDLSQVNYFGSVFLALLLRCHKRVKSRGGELVLCGASQPAAELLKITALDTLWAIYDSREEALRALAG